MKLLGFSFTDACVHRYYSDDSEATVLATAKSKLSSDIHTIAKEFLCIFHDILSCEPCCYWNQAVYLQTYSSLEALSASNALSLDENIVEHYLAGLASYRQITDIINDLSALNDSPEIKTRLYRIPTYITIVEGCLTNLFRSIILILNQTTLKDYAAQKKLQPLCDILAKNGFDLAVSDINVNLRNAINHGGIIFKGHGTSIDFQYSENNRSVVMTMECYQLDSLLEKVYDIASGVLLGISHFINDHMELLTIDRNLANFVSFSLSALELSIPKSRCRYITGLPDNKQLNAEFFTDITDKDYLVEKIFMLSLIIYCKYPNYQQYMISFQGERLQTSWLRFQNSELRAAAKKTKPLDEIYKSIIARKDCMLWDTSDEDIDLREIKYFRFPLFETTRYKINRVQDASTPERKRLRAHLFINDIVEKEVILEIISETIDWLKKLKNVSSPTLPHKHGDMEADSLYIDVFRFDARRNKELYPNNENFVCMVDYNIDGKTTLVDGGILNSIWIRLHHEIIGNMNIAWRESKYKDKVVKIGRNAACPCGSGKKHKKCCGV